MKKNLKKDFVHFEIIDKPLYQIKINIRDGKIEGIIFPWNENVNFEKDLIKYLKDAIKYCNE